MDKKEKNINGPMERKMTVEENFNYLVHFHSMFLRSFDDLLHQYQKQHYGKYEDITVNPEDRQMPMNYYQDTMIKAEDMLKRIEQRYKTNMSLEEIMSDMFVELDQMKNRLHLLLLECGKDNMYLMNKNEEVIHIISRCQRSLTPPDGEKNEELQITKNTDLDKYRNVFNQIIQNIMIPNTLHEYFIQEHVDQIKQWLGMTFKTILFDSNFITFNSKNIFSKLLKNKSHLLFLIEDEDHNKFGGYLSSPITKFNDWISDQNGFLMTIQSNGRIDGMKRFPLTDPLNAFYLSTSDDDPLLFTFCPTGDILINISSSKEPSQSNYSFGSFNNVLTGKQYFIPQRLLIIELKEIDQLQQS